VQRWSCRYPAPMEAAYFALLVLTAVGISVLALYVVIKLFAGER
jgi:hypothetical protein